MADKPNTTAATSKFISDSEWETKLSEADIRKEDMNKLVMDFLISRNLRDVAEKFREESGTEIRFDFRSSDVLSKLVEAIKFGYLERGYVYLNRFYPEVRETDPDLCFRVYQQRVIEQIRDKHTDAAFWRFGYLHDWKKINERFTRDVEDTRSLLLYDDPSFAHSSYHLMDKSKRLELADSVEQAVLRIQQKNGNRLVPKIEELFHMLYHVQKQLDYVHVNYPALYFEEFLKLSI